MEILIWGLLLFKVLVELKTGQFYWWGASRVIDVRTQPAYYYVFIGIELVVFGFPFLFLLIQLLSS